jgi:predicted site-specific integrase-resolvase
MTSEEVELLTIDQLAALSKESRSTIKRRIRTGQLRVVHLSARSVRIRAGDAIAYLGRDADDGANIGPSNVQPIR